MKAIVCTRYGSPDVLTLQDIAPPVPKDHEVLVSVHSASLNAADWHIMRGSPYFMRFTFGFSKPKYPVLGSDVSGYVEAVGENVTRFKKGDEVFGNLFEDGRSDTGMGAFAEFACASEDAFALKPSNITFEEAAAIPLAATTALQALNKGEIEAGKKVLINGASGGVGSFAIQIAKAFDAEVTAVCSTSKTDMVRSLGADHVIDYTKENFTQSGKRYDLIIAANGYHPIGHYKRVLTGSGRYVSVGGSLSQMVQGLALAPFLSSKRGKRLGFLSAKNDQDDLLTLKNLAATGKLKPVIDGVYSLAEIPEAMRYLEEGHVRGKLVVRVEK